MTESTQPQSGQSGKETTPLLSQDNYYGRNDLRPWSSERRIFVFACLIVFSPILVPLFVLYITITYFISQTMTVNHNQVQSAKSLGYEAFRKAPGKKLAIRKNGIGKSDILLPLDFVNERGNLDTCKDWSLRKSIEWSVQEDLTNGPYGAEIKADEDRDQPHYLLHGWTEPYDPDGDELWTTHARTATWAAIYSWTGRLPPGGWINPKDWTQEIDLNETPDVMGYIYLFQVTNPNFYNDPPRTIRVGGTVVNAPDHTPETEGKIFARYGYGQVKKMGDFPKGDPDAYIFKGKKVLEDAQLKILHEYRVMKPTDL